MPRSLLARAPIGRGLHPGRQKRGSSSWRVFFECEEEEAPLPSSKVDLNVLDGRISSELREIVGEIALASRFGSDIRRTLKTLGFHFEDIEVPLDEGFLLRRRAAGD